MTDGSRGIEPGEVIILAGLASDALPCAATITVD
jgi:beta-glucosidase